MKNLLTTLAKNVLLPFELAGEMSATDAAIHWIGNEIINNFKQRFIDQGLSIKGVSEATKIKGKKQKSGFFPNLLDTSIAILLGSMLTGR